VPVGLFLERVLLSVNVPSSAMTVLPPDAFAKRHGADM
jgi:hypothetical protein